MEVPSGVLWVSRADTKGDPPWTVWPDRIPGWPDAIAGEYVMAADISGGSEDPRKAAFDAIEIVDHHEKVQVAEYRGHLDPDLLANELYLAGMLFNWPWCAPEVTGYGRATCLRLLYDLHYSFLYYAPKASGTQSRSGNETRLGWTTTRKTKPMIEANMMEALRDGTHGLASQALIKELLGLSVDETGKTITPPGQFSDLAMAYLIAQYVATTMPFKGGDKDVYVTDDSYSHVYA